MLIVPKVYTTIPSCRLHVVDNDTLEEMPHVFFKVTPRVYVKNKVNPKSGYEKYNFKNNNNCLYSVDIFSYVIIFCLEVPPYLLASLNKDCH